MGEAGGWCLRKSWVKIPAQIDICAAHEADTRMHPGRTPQLLWLSLAFLLSRGKKCKAWPS